MPVSSFALVSTNAAFTDSANVSEGHVQHFVSHEKIAMHRH